MRYAILFLLIIISTHSNAQTTSIRLGAGMAFFSNYERTLAAELVGQLKITNELVGGIGLNPVHMKNTGLLIPVFATIGYHFNPHLQFHLDPGYTIYSDTHEVSGMKYKTKGGFYLGSGFLFKPGSRLYLNAQYSLYKFKRTLNTSDPVVANTNAAYISFGYLIAK